MNFHFRNLLDSRYLELEIAASEGRKSQHATSVVDPDDLKKKKKKREGDDDEERYRRNSTLKKETE